MVNETKKIMEDYEMRITATTIRVPVYRSHSESVNIELEKEVDLGEVYLKTGIVMMVVDANDLTVELLGKSEQLQNWPDSQLLALIVDNPAGQDRQLTPFILIREIL